MEVVAGLKKMMKKPGMTKESIGAEKRKGNEVDDIDNVGIGNIFKRRAVSSQDTNNPMFKKGIREDACQAIARFFYNNAITQCGK